LPVVFKGAAGLLRGAERRLHARGVVPVDASDKMVQEARSEKHLEGMEQLWGVAEAEEDGETNSDVMALDVANYVLRGDGGVPC